MRTRVIQTACKHCGQDIEGSGLTWRDRGGNVQCVPYIDRRAGEVIRPNTRHAPKGSKPTGRLVTFETGMDYRARVPSVPVVARFLVRPGVVRFVVIGTQYGYLRTTGGDVRTWASYSGARRAARRYVPL